MLEKQACNWQQLIFLGVGALLCSLIRSLSTPHLVPLPMISSPRMNFCNCSVLLFVSLCPFWYCSHLDLKGELVALLNLSSWCLVMVERVFLAVPWGCLRFAIVVFPDHTHYFLHL